jgi:hypothetical protein
MARFASTRRPLSRPRLFCIAFIVTFIGVTANLWMLHWLPQLIDQRDELTEPSGGGPSRLPLLASLGNSLNLRIDRSTNCIGGFNLNP